MYDTIMQYSVVRRRCLAQASQPCELVNPCKNSVGQLPNVLIVGSTSMFRQGGLLLRSGANRSKDPH